MWTTDMTQETVEAIIQAGESYHVEFKRNVSSDISKEMVAFANSSGGRIFIGIDDDGTIPGITVTNELKARIQSLARDCDPSINVELDAFNNILIILSRKERINRIVVPMDFTFAAERGVPNFPPRKLSSS